MNQPPPNEPPPSYDAVLSGGYTNQSYQQHGPPLVNQGAIYPPNPPYVIEGNPPPNYTNPPYPQLYPPSTNQGGAYPPITNPPYVADGNQASLLTTPAPPAYIATKDTTNLPDTTTSDGNNDSDNDEPSPGAASSCFLLFAAIPIAMMIIGFQNLDKCPMDDTIPIYFILSGGIAVVIAFLVACTMACKLSCDNLFFGIAALLAIAHFGLQIWGSYLVFRRYSDYKTVKDFADRHGYDMDVFCNPTLFLFAFSMLIVYWIVVPCVYSATKTK